MIDPMKPIPKFVRSELQDSPVLMVEKYCEAGSVLDVPSLRCFAYRDGMLWDQQVHQEWLDDGRFYACTSEGARIEEPVEEGVTRITSEALPAYLSEESS